MIRIKTFPLLDLSPLPFLSKSPDHNNHITSALVPTEDALAIQEAGEGSQALTPSGGYYFVELWHGAALCCKWPAVLVFTQICA